MTKKLLVIGAGTAGLAAIVGLRSFDKENKVEITLVEPKDFTEIVYASYRSPFEPWVAEGSLFSLDKFAKKYAVKHSRSIVTELTKDKAVLKDGTVMEFDVVLVATGAKMDWTGLGSGLPQDHDGTHTDRLRAMKEAGDKVLKGNNILIVGGGLVGSELAGDVAVYAKRAGKTDVKVTLVHSQDHLCPEMYESAARYLESKLRKVGVDIILNDKVLEKDGKHVLQSNGKVLEADTVIKTVGYTTDSWFVKIEGALDAKGYLASDDYFRVQGGDGKVFAYGDCCNTLAKRAIVHLDNMSIIGHNLWAALQGKSSDGDLKKGDNGMKVVMATAGPESGIVQFPWFYTQYLMPWIKNSTMAFFNSKSKLGIESFD